MAVPSHQQSPHPTSGGLFSILSSLTLGWLTQACLFKILSSFGFWGSLLAQNLTQTSEPAYIGGLEFENPQPLCLLLTGHHIQTQVTHADHSLLLHRRSRVATLPPHCHMPHSLASLMSQFKCLLPGEDLPDHQELFNQRQMDTPELERQNQCYPLSPQDFLWLTHSLLTWINVSSSCGLTQI